MDTITLTAATRPWTADPMYPIRYVMADDGIDLGYLFNEAETLPLAHHPNTLSGWVDTALAALRGEYGKLLDACSYVIESRAGLLAAVLVVKQGDTPIIHQLAVQPLHQRQGIGSLLLASAIDALHAAHYPSVLVEVVPDSPHAALLAHHGFVVVQA